MRTIIASAVAVLAVFLSFPAHALNVVSANGFACNQGQKQLVECDGQFPGVQGIFGATGYNIAYVEFSPDNKKRYFYMSDTGCLIMNAADNSAVAVDKSGTKKQFTVFTDAMQWCYTGGQAAPAQPQQAPSQQTAPDQPQPAAPQQQKPAPSQQAVPAQPQQAAPAQPQPAPPQQPK